MPGEKKRSSVKARKKVRVPSKATHEKQLQVSSEKQPVVGPLPADKYAYGTRTIQRTSAQGLSITVQIPPLRRPKSAPGTASRPFGRFPKRLQRPLIALVIVVVAGSFFIFGPGGHAGVKPVATAAAVRTTPDYHPLVPSAEQASSKRYDAQRDMVSYTTSFSGARITVSQQALPSGFSKDPEALKRAADSIKAAKQITTAHGPLYIATNETTGDQMGIYANDTVLVFIHAERKIDDVSWKSFVELLQSKSWDNVK